MCSPDSSDPAPVKSPTEAAQAASACLGEVSSSLAETAAQLRQEVEAGTVPVSVAAKIVARLEELAAEADQGPKSQ